MPQDLANRRALLHSCVLLSLVEMTTWSVRHVLTQRHLWIEYLCHVFFLGLLWTIWIYDLCMDSWLTRMYCTSTDKGGMIWKEVHLKDLFHLKPQTHLHHSNQVRLLHHDLSLWTTANHACECSGVPSWRPFLIIGWAPFAQGRKATWPNIRKQTTQRHAQQLSQCDVGRCHLCDVHIQMVISHWSLWEWDLEVVDYHTSMSLQH